MQRQHKPLPTVQLQASTRYAIFFDCDHRSLICSLGQRRSRRTQHRQANCDPSVKGFAEQGRTLIAVVESLLGGASAVAATLTDIGAAIPTNTAIAVTTQAAGTAAGQAAPTATATSSGRGRGRDRFGNNRNSANKRAFRSRIARYAEDSEQIVLTTLLFIFQMVYSADIILHFLAYTMYAGYREWDFFGSVD